MDSVMHFEIPASDISRAQEFYIQSFGWKTNPVPQMAYTMLQTTEVDENNMVKEKGVINGGMMKRTHTLNSPIITIGVKDIDEALAKVVANGGEVVRESMEVGDMGFSAYFKDTEGNIMGLWQDRN